MKTILPLFPLFFISSFPLLASEIPNVDELTQTDDDSFMVRCANALEGVVSIEDRDVCIFASSNKNTDEPKEEINQCRPQFDWTVEQAAEQLCKNR